MEHPNITVHDKHFEPFIPEEIIQKEVSRIAKEMNHDLASKDPIFLGILNGAFLFASDLLNKRPSPARFTVCNLTPSGAPNPPGR